MGTNDYFILFAINDNICYVYNIKKKYSKRTDKIIIEYLSKLEKRNILLSYRIQSGQWSCPVVEVPKQASREYSDE